jgi:hypothetical protein
MGPFLAKIMSFLEAPILSLTRYANVAGVKCRKPGIRVIAASLFHNVQISETMLSRGKNIAL